MRVQVDEAGADNQPGAVDPELITRWIQFGAYSPILRTHTTKNPDAERRIWAYPEPYSDIMRSTFQLRYRMQPYLYTEGRRTYDTGVAFLRPLDYDSPEAAEALKLTAQDLMSLGVVDEVVPEPEGGAHRDHDLAAANLGTALRRNLERISALPLEELMEQPMLASVLESGLAAFDLSCAGIGDIS